MKKKIEQLLSMAMEHDVSDIHFLVRGKYMQVTMRTINGLEEMNSSAFDIMLFNYLKYLSNMDLGNGARAQSGNFTYTYQGNELFFRFSLLSTIEKQTGVLRILNAKKELDIYSLSEDKTITESFLRWTHSRCGMVVLSGPTGSGETTTLHAILHHIAEKQKLRVVSLEDPIEILDDSYLQLQINEKSRFSYEEGIRQLLRHDPDVIMIGEIRDVSTARMVLRCALSGHMVFTTVHAKSCEETLKRLEELGIRKEDLKGTLSAICAQRIYKRKKGKGRVCLYEILEKKELSGYFQNNELDKKHRTIFDIIQNAADKGIIDKEEAKLDLYAS